MKVLHVTRDYPPRAHGGLSSAVSGWVEAGARVDISSVVLSFDDYRPVHNPAAHHHEHEGILRVEGTPDVATIEAFARRCAPDILHLHHSMLFEVADTLRRRLQVPLIKSVHLLHEHLNELRGVAEPTQSALAQRRAVAGADLLTAPSPSAARRLRQDHAVPPDRPIHILPLAVRCPASPSLHRATPRTILHAGRFADVKGTRDWLEALPQVAEALPEVQFELAGGLPASPRAERRFLRRHVESLPPSVRPRVRWLGWCDADALARAYQRAWLLIAPSWIETFGQSVFEALAHGTPVVAAQVGALEDYLEEGREAQLVPPRSPRSLADAVVTLVKHEGSRHALAMLAPASAGRFAPERVTPILRQVYEATHR